MLSVTAQNRRTTFFYFSSSWHVTNIMYCNYQKKKLCILVDCWVSLGGILLPCLPELLDLLKVQVVSILIHQEKEFMTCISLLTLLTFLGLSDLSEGRVFFIETSEKKKKILFSFYFLHVRGLFRMWFGAKNKAFIFRKKFIFCWCKIFQKCSATSSGAFIILLLEI